MSIPAVARRNSSTLGWLGAAIVALAATGVATPGHAESVYVSQIPSNVSTHMSLSDLISSNQQQPYTHPSYKPGFVAPQANSVLPHGQNYAQTLEIGAYNSVYHLQVGSDNSSRAAIIGAYNNVAVLQSGHNLRSNVALINTIGLNVAVLQPNNSAPVNVLIARLPGGGLLIKR